MLYAVLMLPFSARHTCHLSLLISTTVLTGEKECALAFQAAFESSWHALSAWTAVVALFLSPILQLLAVLARAMWPHAQGAATALLKYQASLPLYTVLAEAAAVVFVVSVFLLRRFIVRRRYLPRAQRRVRLFRARLNRRYASFTQAVERNFRLSARAFPHVAYWTAAGSFAWLAPGPAAWLRENFSVFVTAMWPTLYGLYLNLLLRSQDQDAPNGVAAGAGGIGAAGTPAGAGAMGVSRRTPVRMPVARTSTSTPTSTPGAGTPARSPGSALGRGARVMPQDVDRVLMYWVVFTVVKVLSLVPLASIAVEYLGTPFVRSVAFFLAIWMHLPGPGSGLQVLYTVPRICCSSLNLNLLSVMFLGLLLNAWCSVRLFLLCPTLRHLAWVPHRKRQVAPRRDR